MIMMMPGKGWGEHIPMTCVPGGVELCHGPRCQFALAKHPEPAKGKTNLHDWRQRSEVISQGAKLMEAWQYGKPMEEGHPHGKICCS